MQLKLGTRVECTDETFGKLVDVVVDPTSKARHAPRGRA